MNTLRRIGLAVVVLWGLSACGESAPQDDAPSAAIRLGTGFPTYTPLAAGDEIEIIAGIQGGYHLWGGFLVRGLDPEGVTISFSTTWQGELVANVTYEDDLRDSFDPALHQDPDSDWELAYAGVAVIFDDEVDPDEVSGDLVTLSVRVVDRQGVEVSDSIDVRAICCSL